MSKCISIRLAKENNGEYSFRIRGSEVARTPYGLVTMIENGIHEGSIAKGVKIVDNDYVRYTFNLYNSDDIKAVQNPDKLMIRMRKEYVNDMYDTLKNLDALCLETKYIKTKNIAKILAVGLAATVFLSFTGKMIYDRIKNPVDNDFGRNNEYTNSDSLTPEENIYKALKEKADSGDKIAKMQYEKYLLQQEMNKIYDDIKDEEVNNSKTI